MRKSTAVILLTLFVGGPIGPLLAVDDCQIPCCRLADPWCETEEATSRCPTLTEGQHEALFVPSISPPEVTRKPPHLLTSIGVITGNLDIGIGSHSRLDRSSGNLLSHPGIPLYFQLHALLI
ncbi:MAG: hypothetical protein ACE5GH_03145 [Fidelibacterota bacterium]